MDDIVTTAYEAAPPPLPMWKRVVLRLLGVPDQRPPIVWFECSGCDTVEHIPTMEPLAAKAYVRRHMELVHISGGEHLVEVECQQRFHDPPLQMQVPQPRGRQR